MAKKTLIFTAFLGNLSMCKRNKPVIKTHNCIALILIKSSRETLKNVISTKKNIYNATRKKTYYQ